MHLERSTWNERQRKIRERAEKLKHAADRIKSLNLAKYTFFIERA